MKTNILSRISLVTAVMFALTACNESKFLDLNDPNKSTETDFWRNEADVQAAMATVYSPIRSQMYGYFGAETGFQISNGRSDDTWNRHDNEHMWSITNFINTPSTGNNDSNFARMYWCVHRANTLLANIEKVELSESKMNELIAEARFLRGFSYFILVTNWGEVPLRTIPADTTDEIMCPSSPEEDIWKVVEEDLKFAKEHLPLTRAVSEQGRVTKGAAIAYLGKSYVFQGKFPEAEKELGLLLQAPYTYDLVENFEDNFYEYTEFNKESIFELNYEEYGAGSGWGSEEANSTQGIALQKYIGTGATSGWFKVMPSASLIDAFTKELRPAGSDTKFDKRMYTSFFFKYSDYNDVIPDEIFYDGSFPFDVLWDATNEDRAAGEPDYSLINGVKGRFLCKKYTNWWIGGSMADAIDTPGNRSNNYRVMRFAEVLLLHAEACAQTGNLTQAAKNLKRIRDRAGLAQKTWNTKEEILAEMEHQKLLELCQEGVRFFDLVRWYSPTELRQLFIDNNKHGGENFQPKHVYLPIPDDEINTNKAIQQHPLWR